MSKTFHGRTARLIGQFADNFRQAPGTPAATLLPFSTITPNRNPLRPEDDTLRNTVLPQKRYEQDEEPSAQIKGKLWLNELGFWLKNLMGAPVTTGTGPYTHVFTLNLNAGADALLELSVSDGDNEKLAQYLGAIMSSVTLNLVDDSPNWEGNLIMATEVRPRPTDAFDDNPTQYPQAQPCRCTAKVYDVLGASTLGEITAGPVNIDMDLDPKRLADGQKGYGCVLVGAPKVSGTLTALFTNDSVVDAAETNATKRLIWELDDGADSDPLSLKVDVEKAEFDEPAFSIDTSKGMVRELSWNAIDGAVTVTLVSDVENY